MSGRRRGVLVEQVVTLGWCVVDEGVLTAFSASHGVVGQAGLGVMVVVKPPFKHSMILVDS